MNGDKVLQAMLSFDTEEFDLPREHGAEITLERAVEVSAAGMARILDVLQQHGAKATFFCTVNFAEHAPHIMRRIIDEGHEVASHGIDHWQPEAAHVAESKRRLEELCGTTVNGYRQPRMMPVAHDEVARAGYTYNSSLHPTFIIGRYMHLNVPRTPFQQHGVLQIPVSLATPAGVLAGVPSLSAVALQVAVPVDVASRRPVYHLLPPVGVCQSGRAS